MPRFAATLTTLAFMLLGLGGGSPAHADAIATRTGEAMTMQRTDAAVVPTADGYALFEQIEVQSSASQWVWVRAFPKAPRITDAPSVSALLATRAQQDHPLAEQLQQRPLGPSLAQALYRKWAPLEARDQPLAPPEAPSLIVDEVVYIQGQVLTSTLTGAVRLPPSLEGLLTRYDVQLPPAERARLGTYLSLNWELVAFAGRDNATGTPGPRLLGPYRMDFAGDALYFPLLRRTRADGPVILRAVGPTPLVPSQIACHFDARVEPTKAPAGTVVIRHAAPLGNDVEVAYQLGEQLGLPIDPDAMLTEMVLVPDGAQIDMIELVAPMDAVSRPAIPAHRRVGGLGDILSCLLLGLAPLFLAPESWLLWALQRRARTRSRAVRGRETLGTKVWSLWPLATAAYWLVALDGLARIATLLPLLIGMLQLATPYLERDRGPVRARFKKKRKKDGAETSAASSTVREAPRP